MSLKNDVEMIDNEGFFTETEKAAWARIKTALEPLLSNDTPKSDIVDSTPVYRCICGFETKTDSEHVQYCPCGEKMEIVK